MSATQDERYDPRGVPSRMDELDSQVRRLARELLTLWAFCAALATLVFIQALRAWMADSVG